MLNTITMPSAGQTTDSLTIARWAKAVGDPVARGDVLFEVETDKATLPVESFAKGVLLRILVAEGEKASSGDVVAYVGNEGDLAQSGAAPAAAVVQDEEDDYEPIMPGASSPPAAPRPVAPAAKPTNRVLASPAAKKAARDAGADLARIAAGTGVQPLRKADIERYLAAGTGEEFDLVPLTAMRRTIATRMLEASRTIPAFTVEIEADMTALIALRDRLKERGDKVAFHDLFAKCAAAAIGRHPLINASYTDEGIRVHRKVHVGVAVAVENGLVVPVVRDAGNKSLLVIAGESAALVEKARSGCLLPEDMQGGTITVSNLGVFPVSRFTAIINPPESCILAIGATRPWPVMLDGTMVARPMATVTATFDHRVVDGAYGAAFMADLKAYIEEPAMMLA